MENCKIEVMTERELAPEEIAKAADVIADSIYSHYMKYEKGEKFASNLAILDYFDQSFLYFNSFCRKWPKSKIFSPLIYSTIPHVSLLML